MWFNKITGEVYIGSSLKGSKRLNSYYWPYVLNKTKKSLIYNSLKYGHSNFNLTVLEICDDHNTINKKSNRVFFLLTGRESFYIKWALEIYGEKVLNILTTAGSSLGYRHTIKDRLKRSELKIGEKNNMYNKKHWGQLVWLWRLN